MSDTTTQGVRIEVTPTFIAARSDPAAGRYFFAYHVRITNLGDATVQLKSRHWIITDGNGGVQEVRGAGVVGEQPQLRPGESFEYDSACPLETPVGSMRGSFRMLTENGHDFDAGIDAFTLALPGVLN